MNQKKKKKEEKDWNVLVKCVYMPAFPLLSFDLNDAVQWSVEKNGKSTSSFIYLSVYWTTITQ